VKAKPVKATKNLVKDHPAEPAALGVWGAVTALLVAFGVDVGRATAISGLAAALTPTIVTWWRSR
jgi:hypothetical protein